MFRVWLATIALSSSTAFALTYKGADISSVLTEERAGIIYKDQYGTVKPLEQILAENGINMLRQRVWVTDGDYGVQYNLELAQRAVNAGLMFGLNLHYSNWWTNPGLQEIPPGWPTDIDGLEKTIYDYTLETLNTFAAAGLNPETVTLGNEINSGILAPVGSYENPQNLARLLKSASKAVLASNLSPKPKRLLHLTICCEAGVPEWWYDMVLENGLSLDDFDVHAHSMYPYWGDTASFSNFIEMAQSMRARYGNKEIQVVETGWPTVCNTPEYPFAPDQRDIPLSIEGQKIYFQRMAQTLEAAGASGFNVWEPAWVRNYRLGASCDYSLMFDQNGRAHDSVSVFKDLGQPVKCRRKSSETKRHH